MLTDYGDFSLEEIESVVTALSEFSVDKYAAVAAANAALEGHVENLSSAQWRATYEPLLYLGSLDELKSYEKQLKTASTVC